MYLSLINWGELCYILERDHGEEVAMEMVSDMDKLPVVISAVDRQRVLAAAHIKANCPVSYADAFAVALTQELKGTLVTGDPELKKVAHIVNVTWLRVV